MTRGFLNLMIDTVAAALLTAMVGTGYILWFALPPGTNRTHILWGLLRHQWGAVHFWISAMLLTVLAVHVALHWRWLVMGLSKRFGLTAWATRSPRLAGLTVLAAVALPLSTLAIAAHVSVRPLDTPLHPLVDEPRAGAAPATPGTAAEKATPSLPVPAQGTMPPSGLASSVSTPITSPDASTPTAMRWSPGPRRCWRNGAPHAMARTSPPQASGLTHSGRCARCKTASGGSRPVGLTRAAYSRLWACSPLPAVLLRSTA